MSQQKFANVASGKLASAVASGDTSFTLGAGQGAVFPSTAGGNFFDVTIKTSTAREIVRVTDRTSDTFTVTRGQEDTSAQDWLAGTDVRLHVTAGWMETLSAFIINTALVALKALTPASNKIPYFTSGSAAGLLDFSTDGTLASNSDTKIPSEKAVKTYADAAIASGGILASLIDALGDLIYGSADNTAAKLSGNTTTTKKFLTQTGNGTVSAAPSWGTIVENDVGASTNAAGNTSTAITIDWSLGRTQSCTATGNFTLTHSNMTAGVVYTLEVATGAGSFTSTFSSTSWAGGAAPTLTTTASKTDVFTFYKTIGGTILGGVFGQAF